MKITHTRTHTRTHTHARTHAEFRVLLCGQSGACEKETQERLRKTKFIVLMSSWRHSMTFRAT